MGFLSLLRTFAPYAKKNRFILFIFIVLFIFGLFLFITDRISVYSFTANSIFALSFLLPAFAEIYQMTRAQPLTNQSTHSIYWSPFNSDKPDQNLLPRPSEIEQLTVSLASSECHYICLLGKSGVGKTKIFDLFVENPSIKSKYKIIRINSFEAVFDKILTELVSHELCSAVTQISINDAYDSFSRANDISEFRATIHSQLQKVHSATPLLVIIDQAERIFGHRQSGRISNRAIGIGVFLDELRKRPATRIVFAIRSDLQFDCYDTLCFCAHDTSIRPEELISTIIIHGISFNAHGCKQQNAEAHAKIRTAFVNSIPVEDNQQWWNGFVTAMSLDNAQSANTFRTELFGYLCERFFLGSNTSGHTRIENALNQKRELPDAEVFDIFFSDVIQRYAQAHPEDDAPRALGSILYVISVIAWHEGAPSTLDRIVALSHLPATEVDRVLKFLQNERIVLSPSASTFIMTHGLVARYISNTDRFGLNTDYRDSVWLLAERHVHDTRTPERTSTFLDLANFHAKLRDPAWIIILCAMVYCYVRLLWPEKLLPLRVDYLLALDRFDFYWRITNIDPTYYRSEIYLVTMISHFLWVVFMYDLYEGYVKYTFTGWRRLIAYCLAPTGAVLGVLLAYAPIAAVVPIAVSGITLGILFLCERQKLFASGADDQDNVLTNNYWEWGYHSAMNMAFLMGGMLIFGYYFLALGRGITAAEPLFHIYPQQVVWGWLFLLVSNVGMIWFWWHVKPQQQNRYAWSGRLALYDRGKPR